jgi:hypothetical protein
MPWEFPSASRVPSFVEPFWLMAFWPPAGVWTRAVHGAIRVPALRLRASHDIFLAGTLRNCTGMKAKSQSARTV